MGNEVGIEDSDGATVGSIVGLDVVDGRPSPSSLLVADEEVDKPRADTGPVSEAVLVAGVDFEGVRVWRVSVAPVESISWMTETVSTIIVGSSESVRL